MLKTPLDAKKKKKKASSATFFMSVNSYHRDNQKHLIKLDGALSPEELLIHSPFSPFYISTPKTAVADNGDAQRTQPKGCPCLTRFTRVHTSSHTQRWVGTYGDGGSFAKCHFHPQKQGPNHCFRGAAQDGSS